MLADGPPGLPGKFRSHPGPARTRPGKSGKIGAVMSRPPLPAAVFPDAPSDGVKACIVALPAGPWPTVLAFLAARFPHVGEAGWRARMASASVRSEQGEAITPDTPYRSPWRLTYRREVASERPVPGQVRIVFQDEHLLVADKPHFLAVTPGGAHLHETLLTRLRRSTGQAELSPLHRLDRDTAGLVLFSLRRQDRAAYHRLFAERRVRKQYHAIAAYREALVQPVTRHSRIETSAHFMQMMEVPGSANAQTRISLHRRLGSLAEYRLEPLTGARHQLRVHMAALGAPILGDRLYPRLWRQEEDEAAGFTAPLQLLARHIAFDDPVTGQARSFESSRQLAAPDQA